MPQEHFLLDDMYPPEPLLLRLMGTTKPLWYEHLSAGITCLLGQFDTCSAGLFIVITVDPLLVRVRYLTIIVTSQPASNWTHFLDPDNLYLVQALPSSYLQPDPVAAIIARRAAAQRLTTWSCMMVSTAIAKPYLYLPIRGSFHVRRGNRF